MDPRTGEPLPPEAIQRVLYTCKAVHVYSIPPLTSMKGYEASTWTAPDPQDGNKTREIFTARLRIIESAVPTLTPAARLRTPNRPLAALPDELEEEESVELRTDIVLEDGETGALFAAAPYVEPSVVEHAIDSSRFFAVRVEGEGKKAVLGVGFEDRSDAFDFGVALQEARKILGFSTSTTTTSSSSSSSSSRTGVPQRLQHQQARDYSLKPGENISVKPDRRADEERSSSIAGSSSSSEPAALYSILPPPPPPPPSSARDRRRPVSTSATPTSTAEEEPGQ
ncbi:hypothetical protein MaudMau93_002593 [Microsporum audouinii]